MTRRRTGLRPDSVVVSAGRPEGAGAALNPPLTPASNFTLGGGRVYAREDGTPTWRALEAVMGELEHGTALAFASGMAAAAAVFEQVPHAGRVVLPRDCYQGVVKLAADGADQGRFRLVRLATDDTDGWVAAAANADLLWIESPSNPMLILADLDAIAAAPRRPGCMLAVDNTFATPLNQRPLERGADIVLHSATKYIGGHSDLMGGILVTRDDTLHRRLERVRTLRGAVPGSLEAWLAVRGLRTLAVRLDRSQANAQRVAEFLAVHPAVGAVHYPGLASHPQHELARRQLSGFGGIVSFEVAAGADAADRVCAAARLIHHATSLGAVETTMERRSSYEGQSHLPPGLIRVSVGIEDAGDLCDDLGQALAFAGADA